MEKINFSLAAESLRKSDTLSNLRRNWLFPIAALAFFHLASTSTASIVVAFAISIIIASQAPSIFAFARSGRTLTKIAAVFSAVGICWVYRAAIFSDPIVPPLAQAIESILPFRVNVARGIKLLIAAAAIGFLYLYIRFLLLQIKNALAGTQIIGNLGRSEIIIYSLLILASLLSMTLAFLVSQAFYGTEFWYDIIYTSDSPSLVKENAYMTLTHAENDLRQPLFAVFAAPFMGIPYLISQVLSAPASVQAMLLNTVQILMLYAANFMLAKMMRLSRTNRICFMILSSLTYTHLLFTLMMEQYIVAYFWLVFCVYLICEKGRPDRIALWGAGGTLLTSIILLPAMSKESPVRNFKAWFWDMVKYGLEFVIVILACCRFDIFTNLGWKIFTLSGQTGKNVPFITRIYQYTTFVGDCFLAPNAGKNDTAVDHISWQLVQPEGVSILGVLIIAVCLLSAWLNRNKISSLLAIIWATFSAGVLLLFGWGSPENGQILYSLYFGWAFGVLLFQFVEKVGEKLNLRFLVPAATAACAALLIVVNIPAITDMIRLAAWFYPA